MHIINTAESSLQIFHWGVGLLIKPGVKRNNVPWNKCPGPTKYYIVTNDLNLRSLVSITMHLNPSTNNRLGHISQGDNHYCYTGPGDTSVQSTSKRIIPSSAVRSIMRCLRGTCRWISSRHSSYANLVKVNNLVQSSALTNDLETPPDLICSHCLTILK
jgi:hypothetical protein